MIPRWLFIALMIVVPILAAILMNVGNFALLSHYGKGVLQGSAMTLSLLATGFGLYQIFGKRGG